MAIHHLIIYIICFTFNWISLSEILHNLQQTYIGTYLEINIALN